MRAQGQRKQHLPIHQKHASMTNPNGTRLSPHCGRLRTVADGCARLRTLEQLLANTASTPRSPLINGNPSHAFGKNTQKPSESVKRKASCASFCFSPRGLSILQPLRFGDDILRVRMPCHHTPGHINRHTKALHLQRRFEIRQATKHA